MDINPNDTRFIPAGAGNTSVRDSGSVSETVHPRWRGEHVWLMPIACASCGSSPLARGTREVLDVLIDNQRFIPAGAGNTSRCPATAATRPVHPRWRGEHIGETPTIQTGAGSSPLARGTHCSRARKGRRHRFIPAGAGNTPPLRPQTGRRAVHPRWRGEHASAKLTAQTARGSSPLARGTHHSPIRSPHQLRFIPAGAGNTRTALSRTHRATVHPRWRGEHGAVDDCVPHPLGSSPLARGTRQLRLASVPASRFIPAGAGNTAAACRCACQRPVHPRWRGEHGHGLACQFLAVRFIPAGAGNTGHAHWFSS